jgi:hypothetical protein
MRAMLTAHDLSSSLEINSNFKIYWSLELGIYLELGTWNSKLINGVASIALNLYSKVHDRPHSLSLADA